MGTTSEKLTYLNTTKTLIKEELNLGGANISNEPFRVYSSKLIDIYKDFLANGTDTLWNNWEKVTGSGETITLNNTIEAKMDFVYKGNTSQDGTPTPDTPIPVQVVSGDNTIKVEGKNLCNGITQNYFVNQTATRCGYAVGDSGLIIEVDGVSDYTISSNTVQTRYRVGCLNEIPVEGGSNTIVYNGSNKDGTDDSVTINTNGYKYLAVNATDLTSIQIEKNSTKTLFEEYKLQTYPINLGNIELCKIGTYQDKIAKSTGKNLYVNDKSTHTFQQSSATWRFIDGTGGANGSNLDTKTIYKARVYNGITYTFSSNITASSSIVSQIVYEDETLIKRIDGATATFNETFTASRDGYVILRLYVGANISVSVSNVMLNEGSTALPYEPYGKVWYLNKQIGKVVLDGSENITTTTYSAGAYFHNIINIGINGTNNDYAMSNYYTYSSSYKNNTCKTANQGKELVTRDNFDQSTYITWLGTNKPIFYYLLATPTYEEITDTTLISQLEAIKYSYDSQTNISQTNNDLPFELDVVALGKLS